MTETQGKAARQRLQSAVTLLSEHYDCVQILVSHFDEDGTRIQFEGSGNFYARLEMARRFIRQDQEVDQARSIADELKQQTEEDGD